MMTECTCRHCEARRNPKQGKCACCGGAGQVEAATGEMRPCSRCNSEAFDQWSLARRATLASGNEAVH